MTFGPVIRTAAAAALLAPWASGMRTDATTAEPKRGGKVDEEVQEEVQDAVPHCPCNGYAMESQLARVIAMAYDPLGPRATMKAAEEVFSCYGWQDFPYDVPQTSLLSWAAKKAYAWSKPRAIFGKCTRSDTCVVSFSGAADLGMVASIGDEGPVFLKRSDRGAVFESRDSDAYRFHKFYWETYSAMRDQVGAKLDAALDGCKDIIVTGHSIGSAMASLWQWERLEMPIQQITIGQNPAWFGTPPDVGCRGKRIVSEEDPIPQMRQFKDSRGNVIRHPALPLQLLQKVRNTWKAADLTSCDSNEPIDPECVNGCSTWSLHYQWVVNTGLKAHQALTYVEDLDAAFGTNN